MTNEKDWVNEVIRAAVQSDILSIWELNVIVQKLHAEHVPTLIKEPSDSNGFATWFEEVIADPRSYVLMVEQSGSIVGYLYAQEVKKEESWVRPELHYFMLHHIVVKPDHQKQGLGDGLMKALMAEAKKRGLKRIELDVWSFNHKAQKFFTRYGFVTFNQKMDIVLEEELRDSKNSMAPKKHE